MYPGMEMASCEPMTLVHYLQAIRVGAHPQITTHFENLAVENAKTAEFSGVIGFKMTNTYNKKRCVSSEFTYILCLYCLVCSQGKVLGIYSEL